jgi:hypothetical protein
MCAKFGSKRNKLKVVHRVVKVGLNPGNACCLSSESFVFSFPVYKHGDCSNLSVYMHMKLGIKAWGCWMESAGC